KLVVRIFIRLSEQLLVKSQAEIPRKSDSKSLKETKTSKNVKKISKNEKNLKNKSSLNKASESSFLADKIKILLQIIVKKDLNETNMNYEDNYLISEEEIEILSLYELELKLRMKNELELELIHLDNNE
ncbi:MAG: hypothetical protein MHMPM18_004475, partial [Marteilia pararefringens]